MVPTILLLFLSCVAGRQGSSSDLLERLSHYEVVHISPVVSAHSFHTLSAARPSPSKVKFNVQGFDVDIAVELHRNDMLFHPGYYEVDEVWKDGKKVSSTRRDLADIESCHFQGKAVHDGQESYAALSNCGGQGFEGVVHANDQLFSLVPAHQHMSPQALSWHSKRIKSTLAFDAKPGTLHIMYRQGVDNKPALGLLRCGVSGDEEAKFSLAHPLHGLHFRSSNPHKLRPARNMLGIVDWYVELLVVNDNARYQAKQLLGINVQQDAGNLANQVDAIYNKPHNAGPSGLDQTVRVVMTAQITFTGPDPWAANQVNTGQGEVDNANLLQLFHQWAVIPGATAAHDNRMLFSGLNFTGAVVGFAGVNAMCSHQSSGGIIQTAGFDLYLGAAIIAHEMGHNFGMLHDDPNTNGCQASGFIMNSILSPVPTPTPPDFSTCSANYFKSFSQQSCLLNIPTTSGLDPVCGNGFIEAGEECDCRSNVTCAGVDPCCNAPTCKLMPTAQCPNSLPCCLNCTIIARSSNKICRAAQSDCDIPEVCNGVVGDCPADNYKGAGTTCTDGANGQGSCFGGFCSTLGGACAAKSAGTGDSFSACPSQQGSSPCGSLVCTQASTGSCITFLAGAGGGGSGSVQVPDGVPCATNKQCKAGVCVDSEQLNDRYHWSYGPWADCYSCDEIQTRTVSCTALDINNNNVTASDWMCSPTTRTGTRNCVNATLNCAPRDENSLSKKARQIADEYGAKDKASALRALVPRLYGPSDFSPDDPAYWKGIIILALPPLFIGVACLIWCMGHYTSGCGCGDAAPDPMGYTKSQRFVPWAILMSLALVALIFASIAQYYNGELRRGVNDPDVGAIALIDAILVDALSLANSLEQPLDFVSENGRQIMDQIMTQNVTLDGIGDSAMAGADSIQMGLARMVMNFSSVVVMNTSGVGNTPPLITVCTLCGPILAVLANASSEVNKSSVYKINENAQQIRSLLFTYRQSLVDGEQTFDLLRNKTVDLQTYLQGKQGTLNSYKDQVQTYEAVRFPFALILFALPYVFALMNLIGFLAMKACFKHQGILAWTMLVTMWPLMGAHLSLAMTFGDSCVYMDQTEAAVAAGTTDDPWTSAALQACLTDTSLVDALNLTQAFAPPSFSLPPASFSSPQLEAALSQVQALTLADMGITPAVNADYQNNLAAAGLPPTATEADLNTAAGSSNGTVANASTWCLTIINATKQANATLTDIKSTAASITASEGAINTSLTNAYSSFTAIDAELRPLEDACASLRTQGFCGSIGNNYRVFKDTWCGVITTAFSFFALCCLVLAIFSGAFVYLSIMLTKRFGVKRIGKSAGKYREDAEMYQVDRGNRRERRERRERRRRDSAEG